MEAFKVQSYRLQCTTNIYNHDLSLPLPLSSPSSLLPSVSSPLPELLPLPSFNITSFYTVYSPTRLECVAPQKIDMGLYGSATQSGVWHSTMNDDEYSACPAERGVNGMSPQFIWQASKLLSKIILYEDCTTYYTHLIYILVTMGMLCLSSCVL